MALSLSSLLANFNPFSATTPVVLVSSSALTAPIATDTRVTTPSTMTTFTFPGVLNPSDVALVDGGGGTLGGDTGGNTGGAGVTGTDGQTATATGSATTPGFVPPSAKINLADCVTISEQIIDRQYVKNSMTTLENETITFVNISPILLIDVILKTTGGLAYTPASFRLAPSESRDVILSLNPIDINVLPEGQSTIVTVLQLTTNTAVFSEFTPLAPGVTGSVQYEVPLGKFLEERFKGSPGTKGKMPEAAIFAQQPFYRAIIDKINYNNIPSPTTIRWRGFFNLEGGTYKIIATTDDGMRIFIDDIMILNEWFVQSSKTYSLALPLAPGIHGVRIEYFNDQGKSAAAFSMVRQ